MDGLLADKMKDLLADPDAMARVMDMAGKLFSQPGGEEQGDVEKVEQIKKTAIEGKSVGSEDDRIRLIHALCPYLNDQRREAAMALTRILKLISLAQTSGVFKGIF